MDVLCPYMREYPIKVVLMSGEKKTVSMSRITLMSELFVESFNGEMPY